MVVVACSQVNANVRRRFVDAIRRIKVDVIETIRSLASAMAIRHSFLAKLKCVLYLTLHSPRALAQSKATTNVITAVGNHAKVYFPIRDGRTAIKDSKRFRFKFYATLMEESCKQRAGG